MSDLSNPYAPPKADVAPEPDVLMVSSDVSLGKRFLNVFIDNIVRVIFAAGAAFLCKLLDVAELGTFFIWFTFPAYYIFFEGLLARTPGKFITGTRVVAVGGGRPTFMQIVGRTFARVVPFEPFSFLGGTPTGWHDRWSGTRVVDA
jgi:uncharacterized RDD family membrane protein YckC